MAFREGVPAENSVSVYLQRLYTIVLSRGGNGNLRNIGTGHP